MLMASKRAPASGGATEALSETREIAGMPVVEDEARIKAVAALKDTYASGDEARRGIEARLTKAFAAHASDASVPRVIAAVQSLFTELMNALR